LNRLTNIGKLVATDCVDDRARTANALDDSENAVLINSIASALNFTTEEKQAVLKEDGRCARFERLCDLFRFALAELDSVRVPDSGSLHRFIDANKNRRYSKYKSKKQRFYEF
jgi:hypothetical protein